MNGARDHSTSDFRTGLAILGWIISWSYPVFQLPILMTTATQYDDEAWDFSFAISIPVALVALTLICIGGRTGSRLYFLAIPHLLTVAISLATLPAYFWPSTVLGHHLAAVKLAYGGEISVPDDLPTPLWHRAFVPAHFFCLAAFAWAAWHFRPRRHESWSAHSARGVAPRVA